MANWDHRSNIGTHPILSTDPQERLNAQIEAAAYQHAVYELALARLRQEAKDAGVDMFEIRGAANKGRSRAYAQAMEEK